MGQFMNRRNNAVTVRQGWKSFGKQPPQFVSSSVVMLDHFVMRFRNTNLLFGLPEKQSSISM